MLFVLQNTTSANGDSTTQQPQNVYHKEYGIYQANITGTATVTLYGRTSSNMPWIQVSQFTSSGSERITLFPEMKDTVSSYSSGTVRTEIWE